MRVGDHDRADLTRRLCARNTGIGADGIEFFAGPAPSPAASACTTPTAPSPRSAATARAAWPHGWPKRSARNPATNLEIATDAGLRICRIDRVHTDGVSPSKSPPAWVCPAFAPRTVKLADGAEVAGVEVSTGNPHFVIVGRQRESSPLPARPGRAIGAEICAHRDFPHQTNVEFVRVVSEREIEIRIFERGVGPDHLFGHWQFGLGHCGDRVSGLAFRRSPSSPPAARKPSRGMDRGTELFLTGPATLIARGEAW